MASGEETGLKRNQTMSELGGPFSVKTALDWFDLVLASLDCYTWVLGEGLVSAATLVGEGAIVIQLLYIVFCYSSLTMANRRAATKTKVPVFTGGS